MPQLQTNGVRLQYELEGKGPCVALLHPIGLDLHCWDGLAAVLSKRYAVLRMDFRGHGGSDMGQAPYRLEDMAEDVHRLLEGLGLKPAHVVGLSLGGMVAQVLALQHPDDVRSLVVAGAVATLPDQGRKMMADRARAAEEGGMKAVVAPTLERWFTAANRESKAARASSERLLSTRVEGWSAAWHAIAGLDTKPRLAEIRVPVLLITGEHDVSAPPPAIREMASMIPGATAEVMSGVSHMAPLESPSEFSAAVQRFLETIH